MSNIPVENRGHSSLISIIQNELKTRIINGAFKPGEKLPSEPELAMELGVSRNSLREAIGLLQREGLLVKRHGVGNFVTDRYPIIRGGIERLAGITEFIRAQGLKAGSKVTRFELVECPGEIGQTLDAEPGDRIFIMETIKYASEVPVALCADFIPLSIAGNIDPDRIHDSIFDGLRDHYGVDIRYAECDLIPMTAGEELTGKLSVEAGTPVLLLEQIHYDSLNRRVLYSKSYFPVGKFTFKLIRKR